MAGTDPASAARFATRVADYVRWRPRYPDAAIDLLREHAGLAPGTTVADIGAGTGILTGLLLEAGADVVAVEPGSEMRAALESQLGGNDRLDVRGGTGEATGIDQSSVDLATIAQALHWMDAARTREELRRILRPPGHVALLWNSRHVDGTPFLEGYEQLLLEFGTDYASVRHDGDAAAGIDVLFTGAPHERHVVPNEQRFDAAGVRGRARSSSYVPGPGQPGHDELMAAIDALVAATADTDGTVAFRYTTEVWIGQLLGAHDAWNE